MNKESMLKRAFNQAMVNDAVRHVDEKADFLVIKNYMTRYAKKHGVDVSEEEIEKYIVQQKRRYNESLRGFSFHRRMMK